MKFIAQKVDAGVLDLSSIPVPKLIRWSQATESREDKDVLGCEIMYRRKL